MNNEIVDESCYTKPAALIDINRKELTVVSNKVLNFFIQQSTSGFEIDKNGKFINEAQCTNLSTISKGIGSRSREMERLKENILRLGSSSARYGVINLEKDAHKNKENIGIEGRMSYVDFIEIHQDGTVKYKLGEKFFSYIEEMLVGCDRYFRPSIEIKNKLTSIAATVFYELAYSYTNNSTIPLIKIDEGFMDLLGISNKYIKDVYELKRKFITPALKQLRTKEILNLDFEILEKNDGKYIRLFKVQNTSRFKPYSIYEFIAMMKNAKSITAYARKIKVSDEKDNNSIDTIDTWKELYTEYLELHKKISISPDKLDLLKSYTKKFYGISDLKKLFYLKDTAIYIELHSYINSLKAKNKENFIIYLLLQSSESFSSLIQTEKDKECFYEMERGSWDELIYNTFPPKLAANIFITTTSSKAPLLIDFRLNIDALRLLEHEFSQDMRNVKLGFIIENRYTGIDMISLKHRNLTLKQG